MYIIQNIRKKGNKQYSYTFLAESYWDGKKSCKKIIANLSKLPAKTISTLKNSLKGSDDIVSLSSLSIEKSIDYGYTAVLIEIMKKLKIDQAIERSFSKNDKERPKLALLMIIGKIVTRGSKLGIVNWIKRNKEIAQLLRINDLNKITEKDLYAALVDLDSLQNKIEDKWCLYNKKKLNTIFLYDITSYYFEGNMNELAAYGYNRDKKKGKKIVTVGLITDRNGFPLKIKLFKGNMADHQTVQEELAELKKTFDSKEIILIGDRGMKIRYNLEGMEEKKGKEAIRGIKYITGLTINEIRNLEKKEIIQLSLFDKKLVEVEHGGKRYILCVNPCLAKEKKEHRLILKSKFDLELAAIQRSYTKEKTRIENNKRRLSNGHKNKNLKIEFTEKEIDGWKYKIKKFQIQYKMQSVYAINITKDKFTAEFRADEYENLEKYDGKYIFETTVKKEELGANEVRDLYKKLQKVEHAFQDMKTGRLDMRPVFHRKEKQTRAHALTGMFAYAIIHEMEKSIYPWLKELKSTTDKKLSFGDITEELKMIKLSVLSFGNSAHQEIKITKLNEIQKTIFKKLEIKESILASH